MKYFISVLFVLALAFFSSVITYRMTAKTNAATTEEVKGEGSLPLTSFTPTDETPTKGSSGKFLAFQESVVTRSFIVRGGKNSQSVLILNDRKDYQSPQCLTIILPHKLDDSLKKVNPQLLIGMKISAKGRLTDRGVVVDKIEDVEIVRPN